MIFMGGSGMDPGEMMVGMAVGSVVGKQMANTMNDSMQNMQQQGTPGAPPPIGAPPPVPGMAPPVPGMTPPPVPVTQYNVVINGQNAGPFDMNTLAQMVQSGQLTPRSQVWKQGWSGWADAGTVSELSGLFNAPAADGTNQSDYRAVAMPQSQFHKEGIMQNEGNFYSTDRLVKFGMSTNVAQQMIGTMNFALENAQNSGVQGSMHTPKNQTLPGPGQQVPEKQKQPDMVYYATIEGVQTGPFCETELARLINDRKLTKETYIWHTGLSEWAKAETIPAILRLVALAPPPPPTLTPPPPPPPVGE
jgi:hypothetical protein